MELRHFRYFVALAEELHFGRAARRLRIAQPPLSRQIRDLEDELAAALFTRNRRGVSLTAAGNALLVRAREVLSAVDRAAIDAQRAGRGEVGTIAIGYVASAAYNALATILREFRANCPGVAVRVRQLPPTEQLRALRARELDVGLLRVPFDDSGVKSAIVRKETLVAAIPSDHRLASRKRLALIDLADEPFVLFPRIASPPFFDYVVSLCQAAGFSPQIAYEAPHFDLLSLVSAGFGVSLVPSSTKEMRREGLVLRPIVGSPRADLVVVWRAEEPGACPPAVRDFVQVAKRSSD
ncbi:LysR family transcriptional regulator [soil metagenome]